MNQNDLKPAEQAVRDPGKLTLEDVVTPIFDYEMGQRLATLRMQKFWRLEDLAPKLGLNATTLGRLESGQLAVPKHAFTVSKLEDIFGELGTKYIILNRYGATYDQARIYGKFMSKVRRERKQKPRGEHWTHKRLKEGKPTQGYSFLGIPGEVWDEANRIFKEREKKHTKKVK